MNNKDDCRINTVIETFRTSCNFATNENIISPFTAIILLLDVKTIVPSTAATNGTPLLSTLRAKTLKKFVSFSFESNDLV